MFAIAYFARSEIEKSSMELGLSSSVLSSGTVSAAVVGLVILALIWKFFVSPTPKEHERAGVPKGSLGWPLVGESLFLFSGSAVEFTQKRVARYGKVFKTHLLGDPTFMVTDPDVANYILSDRQQQFHGMLPTVSNLKGLLGSFHLSEIQGVRHDALHKIVQASLSPDVLKLKVADMESIACDLLESFVGKTVHMANESKKLTLQTSIWLLLGLHRNDPGSKRFQEEYVIFDNGLVGAPIYFPGTALFKATKAKKQIHAMISDMLQSRQKKGIVQDTHKKVLLDALQEMEDDPDKGTLKLSNTSLCEMLCAILFAAHDSTAGGLTWIMKFLSENPEAYERLQVEHDEIRKNKTKGEVLTWTEIKSMKYTLSVILESLRLANVAIGLSRSIEKDAEYGGYVLPKGYKVMVSLPHLHSNPELYDSPLKFDPSRFEKNPPARKNFLPFGYGNRHCAGSELAKTELSIFLHHLTTYRWGRVGKDSGTQNWPFPTPKDQLPLRFMGKRALNYKED